VCVNDTQGERRADSCYGWNRSSAPPYGAGGKSRRVATNGASGRFELDWRLGAPWQLAYFCDIRVSMKRQSAAQPKKRGPPATGKGEPILVRLQPAQLAALDAWIARQDAQLSRPEAIRRLFEQALAVSQPVKSRTRKARSTALDLASTQLDRLLDPSAPDEERQRRKRRLLKGPKEFRDMRDAVRSRSKS
jgi:hypothetical protein